MKFRDILIIAFGPFIIVWPATLMSSTWASIAWIWLSCAGLVLIWRGRWFASVTLASVLTLLFFILFNPMGWPW